MPVGAIAYISGTVAAAEVGPGRGVVSVDLSAAEGLLEGTVSREALSSVDGPSIGYRFRIRLAGEWIPPEDLLGPLEIEEGIDTHVSLFSFNLVGARHSLASTSRTWTRTPVEVWITTGRPGAYRERLRVAGHVLTCEQAGGNEPALRVSCADQAGLYDRWEVCLEAPPSAGLTRGEICAEAARSAGIPAWDIPSGAVYDKPVQAISTRLFDWLRGFGEPEGWCWRFRPDGVLEAYVARLRAAPEPVDHVWSLGDVVSIDTSPPRDVPSRWVARGTSLVLADEAGVTTRVTRTEVVEPYAPKVCTQMQLPDGSVVSTGIPEEPEAERITSVIEDQVRERAGKTIEQRTREWGWYNPMAAKLRTPAAGEPAGPVEEGYFTAQAWIDQDGELRAWPREAFVQIGERCQVPTYDAEGTTIRARTEVRSWYRKSMGVRSALSTTLNVVGAGVGADGQSWFVFERSLTSLCRIEDYGVSQVDEVAYEYHPTTGAARREVQDSYGYVSPRTAVEGVPWYVLYDGTGQRDLVAPWGLRRRQTVLNILTNDGHLAGKVETTAGYRALKRVAGAYDWGDFRSNEQVQAWATLKRVNTQYNVLGEDQYEEIVTDEAGRQTPRLITGRVPLPRFRTSSWTSLVQQPLNVVLDDASAEAWWGFSRAVVDNEYVLDAAEARQLALSRRARLLSHKHQVVRPLTLARPGDTVLLVDGRSGIHGRCLVTAVRESWELAPRTQVLATYTLEQPL